MMMAKTIFNQWLWIYKNQRLITDLDKPYIISIEEQISWFKKYYYENYGKELTDNQITKINIKEFVINPNARTIATFWKKNKV